MIPSAATSTILTGTTITGTIVGLGIDLAAPQLPRTTVDLETDNGRVQFVLPGANGPPVVVGGVPLLELGQTWQVQLQPAGAGLVPVALGHGMQRLDAADADAAADAAPPPWALNGLHYAPEQLPLVFLMNSAGSQDLGADTTEAVVQQALADWSGVGCSSFAFAYGGRTDAGFDDDGVNVLSWEDDSWDWGGQVAGLAATRFDTSSGDVVPVGADLVFNGVDWTWNADTGDIYLTSPTLHAGSVVLHELGHVTGMDHEMVQVSATMFFAYIGGDWQGSLAGDDRRGLCENYGTGSDECAVDEDCAGIDDQARVCRELDGIKVCDEVFVEVGGECSRTAFPCADACVFTNNQATDGYCSVRCETEADCPQGYTCGTPDLFLYDDPTVDETLCLEVAGGGDTGDTGPGGDGGADAGGGDDGDAGDTGAPSDEGCGCGAASAPGLAALLLLPILALRRRPSGIVRRRIAP